MFIQCKWTLIHDIAIVLLLCSDTICATNIKNATRLAGVVENITVHALEDGSHLENNDMLKALKLNISWMPPSEGREPFSYSIMIKSISKETDVNKIECTGGSALYIVGNKSPFSILVPQSKLLNDMSQIQIRLNCTYKIQVYANPIPKSAEKLSEVIYTVPECIGHKCSCTVAKAILPIPKVKVIQMKENIVIKWNITSDSSYIYFYIISIGMPLLTSKAGLSVYNITKINNVTSTINTFDWDLKINYEYLKIKNGYKILVAATDYRGCLGTPGSFTIVNADETKTLNGNIIWLLIAGVVICIILGFLSIVLIQNKNGYQFMWPSKRLILFIILQVKDHQNVLRSLREKRRTMSELSASTFKLNQWPNPVFQNRNIDIYVEQKSEEICCKEQNNEFEVSYKCINVISELGKGQFGRVYLASLNNNEDTLVAVKMSQCRDASNEPQIRHQLLEEIKIMKTAGSHPHLVSLMGCCTLPDNPICILLEYMDGGDLLAYLHSKRKIEPDDTSLCNFEKTASRYVNIAERDKSENENLYVIERQQFIKFALDISRGMEHLEAKGIIHRDLAARNILLTSDLTLKVSDFGLSRNGIYVINNVAGKVRQLPIRWMSPEAVRDHAFSSKSDVWSFGIILWEIGTLGSFPYADIQDDELLRYLIQDKCRLACPDTISHDIYKIMRFCWSAIPRDRPSFAQLVLSLQTLKEPHSMRETSNPCYILLSH